MEINETAAYRLTEYIISTKMMAHLHTAVFKKGLPARLIPDVVHRGEGPADIVFSRAGWIGPPSVSVLVPYANGRGGVPFFQKLDDFLHMPKAIENLDAAMEALPVNTAYTMENLLALEECLKNAPSDFVALYCGKIDLSDSVFSYDAFSSKRIFFDVVSGKQKVAKACADEGEPGEETVAGSRPSLIGVRFSPGHFGEVKMNEPALSLQFLKKPLLLCIIETMKRFLDGSLSVTNASFLDALRASDSAPGKHSIYISATIYDHFEALQRAVGYVEENRKVVATSSDFIKRRLNAMPEDETVTIDGHIRLYMNEVRKSILDARYIRKFNTVLKKINDAGDCQDWLEGRFEVANTGIFIKWVLRDCGASLSKAVFVLRASSQEIAQSPHPDPKYGIELPFVDGKRFIPSSIYNDLCDNLLVLDALAQQVDPASFAVMLKKQFNDALQDRMTANEGKSLKLDRQSYNLIMPEIMAIAENNRQAKWLEKRFARKGDASVLVSPYEGLKFYSSESERHLWTDYTLPVQIKRGAIYNSKSTVRAFLETYTIEDLEKMKKEMLDFVESSIGQEECAIDYIKEAFPVESMQYYLEKFV